jgi:hypothetical protein
VHLTHAAGVDGDERRRDGGGSLEIVAVCDLDLAASGLLGHRPVRKRVGEWIGRRSVWDLDRVLVRRERPRERALEDPKIMGEDLAECFGGHAEIRRQDVRRRMGDPVGHQQGVELRLFAVVEREDEGAANPSSHRY